MKCSSPKVVICYGKGENGKQVTLFRPWTPELERFLLESKTKHHKVGCGKCLACRIEYAKKWAIRLDLQRKVSDNAYFVTLTYDDANLKYFNNSPNATIVKQDIQLFLKRLRFYCSKMFRHSKKIIYFCCGEYGDKTIRPHYHMIIFNLPFNDFSEWFPYEKNGKLLRRHMYSDSGEMLFYSKKLQELWSNGNVQVEEACRENMEYTCRYVLKKKYGKDSKVYEKLGVNAPFLLMSQGIAGDYLRIHKDTIYQDDAVYLLKDGVAKSYKPPRYFDNIMMLEKPELIEKIKQDRERAILFDNEFNKYKSDAQLVTDVKSGEYRKIKLNKKIKRDLI